MGTFFEALRFVDEKLSYVDAPISGFMVSPANEVFAFRCYELIVDRLWHWLLVPVPSTSEAVDRVFAAIESRAPERWLSVIEDFRAGERRYYEVEMNGVPIPAP